MENYEYIPDYVLAYLHREATAEQQMLAKEWLVDTEHAELFSQIKKIESLTSDLGMLRKFDLRKGKSQVRRKYKTNKFTSLVTRVQQIAAILLVPALLAGGWIYSQKNKLAKELTVLMVSQEISTQPGTKIHLFLPDSTEVWLNSSSNLKFPSAFAGNERRVILEGEAFFKVYKNKEKPFIVSITQMDIEAVGTEFNVSAYPGDYQFSTTLAEGKVKITDKLEPQKAMYIDPGIQMYYDIRKRVYKSENVRVEDVIAWRDGVLIFNETPFYEVAAKLGRWFNADIQISDQAIANYRFTGTFTSESLDQVLELLSLSTPISYSSSKRKILDNRTFTKQEIKIGYKSSKKTI